MACIFVLKIVKQLVRRTDDLSYIIEVTAMFLLTASFLSKKTMVPLPENSYLLILLYFHFHNYRYRTPKASSLAQRNATNASRNQNGGRRAWIRPVDKSVLPEQIESHQLPKSYRRANTHLQLLFQLNSLVDAQFLVSEFDGFVCIDLNYFTLSGTKRGKDPRKKYLKKSIYPGRLA